MSSRAQLHAQYHVRVFRGRLPPPTMNLQLQALMPPQHQQPEADHQPEKIVFGLDFGAMSLQLDQLFQASNQISHGQHHAGTITSLSRQ